MAQKVYPGDGDVIAEVGDGITVRRLRDDDAASLSRHADNPNIRKCMRDGFPNPYTEEASKAWIDLNSDPKTHVRSGRWAPDKGAEGPAIPTHYTIGVNGEACGGIGLVFGADVYFRTAELGYWLSQEHWGQGVMSRVVPAFIEWTWETFGVLVRLNSGAFDFNRGSQRVLEKAGFVYEGRRAHVAYKDGRIVGEVLYGALRPGGPEM